MIERLNKQLPVLPTRSALGSRSAVAMGMGRGVDGWEKRPLTTDVWERGEQRQKNGKSKG